MFRIAVSEGIALARYVHHDIIRKNFLFCEELKTATKTKDVFQFVKDFFAKHALDIKKTIDFVCTGSFPAMLGMNLGFMH